MRRHLLFIAGILVAAGAVAFFAMTALLSRPLFAAADANGLTKFLNEVQSKQKPRTLIDLTTMYGWNGRSEVLDPSFTTREWRLEPTLPKCDALATSGLATLPATCESGAGETPQQREVAAKSAELQRILRGDRVATDDFLLTSPFVDETGRSYAQWLFEKDIAPLNDVFWVSEHLSLFKPDELPKVLERFGIRRDNFATIASLEKKDLRELVEGTPALVTQDDLFIRDHSRLGFSPLSYSVYDRRQLRTNNYELQAATATSFCLERIGNVCWTYNSQTAIAHFEKYAWIFLIFALVTLVVAIGIYVRDMAEKAAARKREKLSLQVLSHEFRTPVAAMIVMLEQLRKTQTAAHAQDHDTVLRISSEAFKLQRIIEMTKTYIEGKRFNRQTIAVNEWVEEFALEDPRIAVQKLATEKEILVDPYWLKFALTNLVQNAFNHGCEPVVIRLSESPGKIAIAVEDRGACEFESLAQMTKPFEKSAKSQGMGLGLNITETIVKEWGGVLSYRTQPTSFTISMET